jgi:myo-inositol-1(or 4)-monophosphatase
MVGVILNPFKAQLYTAIRNQGSYLTTLDPELCLLLQTKKLPLYPPQPLSLKTSIVAVSEHDRNTTDKRCKDVLDGRIQGVRIYGSTALDFVNVACGFIDAKVSTRHTAREICAGWLIVMEAGGVVVSGKLGGSLKCELMAEPELVVDNLLVVRAAKKEEMEVMVMSYCMLMEDYQKRMK